MSNWTPREKPSRKSIDGQYVRLEPLDISKHGDALYKVCTQSDSEQRFRWLPEYPPKNREEFQVWSQLIGM